MASIEAIAIKRERAVARVKAALESRGVCVDVSGLDRDPRLAEAELLERIADALEGGKTGGPSDAETQSLRQSPAAPPSHGGGHDKGKARK